MLADNAAGWSSWEAGGGVTRGTWADKCFILVLCITGMANVCFLLSGLHSHQQLLRRLHFWALLCSPGLERHLCDVPCFLGVLCVCVCVFSVPAAHEMLLTQCAYISKYCDIACDV
jgi:hypothetical protein